jgi:hypothetical protein
MKPTTRIEILSGPLVKIFTACLALGYIPEAWQRVSVIFIPKPGRTLYELAKSFRPISLTFFLLKTMERLVDQSTRMGHLIRFPLEPLQHAYQRGRYQVRPRFTIWSVGSNRR